MAKKILIAFGSRYGSTEEIASEIVKVLEDKGALPELMDLKARKKPEMGIGEYDGYIVGSGIKIGKWTKEAENFLKDNCGRFREGAPFAMFVSCGLAEEDHDKAIDDYITKITGKYGIEAELYDAFGPMYDFTKDSRLGFLNKKIVKSMSKNSGQTYEDGKKYDFRDWERIREFALEFEEMLNEE
ncbi:MAG TPA: flavodoxin domain-containing protein [Candidatus Methanofastidiosa archaeon]|nr:flavodoxin domain-containing protein [Candidatus Methanofastidiosa archaeon]